MPRKKVIKKSSPDTRGLTKAEARKLRRQLRKANEKAEKAAVARRPAPVLIQPIKPAQCVRELDPIEAEWQKRRSKIKCDMPECGKSHGDMTLCNDGLARCGDCMLLYINIVTGSGAEATKTNKAKHVKNLEGSQEKVKTVEQYIKLEKTQKLSFIMVTMNIDLLSEIMTYEKDHSSKRHARAKRRIMKLTRRW